MSNNIVSHGKRMVREDLIKKLLNGDYSVKLKDITNIQSLTDEQINELKAGDIVLKKTGEQTHAYIVSYKEEGQGICLTYADATYLETISYDYVDGNWVYNSKDSTVVASKDYVDSLLSGALKREIVETLPTEDIDTNTIYMVLDSGSSQQGNVYNEYLYINNAWELIGTTATASVGLYLHNINLQRDDSNGHWNLNVQVLTSTSTPFTLVTLNTYLKNNGLTGGEPVTSHNKVYGNVTGMLHDITSTPQHYGGEYLGIYANTYYDYPMIAYYETTSEEYLIKGLNGSTVTDTVISI